MDYSQIRGFNYQPGYGSCALEVWRQFDAGVVDRELGLGKRYFPGMMAIRLWLSWDAFLRDEDRFCENFETALGIAAKHGLVVMPVLFNRWHCGYLDAGGIYTDHFLPGVSWVRTPGMFLPFLERVVGEHARDRRVFAWDLCNEPFSYTCAPEEIPDIVRAEFAFHCDHGLKGIEQIEPISDILCIHPYWTCQYHSHKKSDHESLLDEYVAFSKEIGKPLLATETCWGAADDAKRVEIIRYTLGELKKRNIGWLAHLLNHSLIADAHRPQYGPMGEAGYMAFIEADGSLRAGHEVFNEF